MIPSLDRFSSLLYGSSNGPVLPAVIRSQWQSNTSLLTAPTGIAHFLGSLVGGLVDQIETPLANPSGQQQLTAARAQQALPYLDLSDAAGMGQGAPAGWERLPLDQIGGVPLHDKNTGFDAEVFRRSDSGEVAVVYRGSESPIPFLNDWVEDGRQVAGEHSPQQQQAIRLAQAAKRQFGDNLSFAGHSLGGALAQTSAIATGNKAYVFDSAGLDRGTLAVLGEEAIARHQHLITNIALEGEFVTDLDRHRDGDASHTGRLLGDVFYVDGQSFRPFPLLDNPLTRHFITPLRDGLAEVAGEADRTDDTLDVLQWGLNYVIGGLTARH